jgi:hypothetical protein
VHAAEHILHAMTFEKQNHHFVPRFWLRQFTGPNGQLFGRTRKGIREVSPRFTMQDNWLYTIFDGHWNPSDSLENAISVDVGKNGDILLF